MVRDTVQRAAEVPLQIGRFKQKKLSCNILPAAAHDLILGEPWLRQHRALIEYDAEQGAIAHVWRGKRRVRIQSCSSVPCMVDKMSANTTQPIGQTAKLLSSRHMQAEAKHACSVTGLTPDGDQHFLVVVRCKVQQHLAASINVAADTAEAEPMTPEQAHLHAVLNEYSDILTAELPAGVPGERPGAGEVIPLEPGSRPVFRPPYRLSPAEQAEVVRTVQGLLAKGFIRPSTSPFGAPVLFVAKKDGTLRMCVDYRGLNNVTVHNKYPLPRIDEMLDRLQGAKVFSSLDLAAGYHQLGLRESDVPKTAFCTPDGLYEFLVMPFGLTNAPAVFQNAMDSIFRQCRAFVCVHMDNLMIFSKSHEQHLQHLRIVLDLLRRNRLFVKPSKCTWLRPELSFLGHLVGQDGIKVDPAKIQVVRDEPRPENLLQLRQFLGLTNYFRRFVQGYAARVTPLVRLTKKDMPFVWSSECQEASEQLKEYLISAPVLAMPDFSKAWELVSDGCGFAIGVVLLQEGRAVAYYARSLSSAERNYHATDQELLGCVDALKHWRCYLEGAEAHKFTLVADHNPLVHLQTQKDLSRRQARWSEYLQRFKFRWHYRPGRTNGADGISRMPHLADHQLAAAIQVQETARPGAVRTAPDHVGGLAGRIRQGYAKDSWFEQTDNTGSLMLSQGLWWHEGCVVVPDHDGLRRELMYLFHDVPYAGHVGVNRTTVSMQKHYWWPKMGADITAYVQACATCQRSKPQAKRPAGLLQPLPVPDKFWASVSMDLITGLPKTSAGLDCIVVFVDRLSKMTHFVGCKGTVDSAGKAAVGHCGEASWSTRGGDLRQGCEADVLICP